MLGVGYSEDGRGVAPRRERQVPTPRTAAVRGRWEATRVFFYGQRGTATPANRLRSRPPAVATKCAAEEAMRGY